MSDVTTKLAKEANDKAVQIARLQAENEHMRLKALAVAGELQEENERLSTENAKLREQLAKARDPQRIGGQADPSSFVYAIEQLREFRWQHATNDEDAIPYINNVADAHERETAKLRDDRNGWKKLCVDQLVTHIMHEEMLDNENAKLRELCERCAIELYVNGNVEDAATENLFDDMRELGIEVDE